MNFLVLSSSAWFLDIVSLILSTAVANCINLSMKLDTFPLQCKEAKIKPLFKKAIKTEAKSYRFISLLPVILMVMQKLMHYQIQDYLQRNQQLYSYQSGFWANHPSDTHLPQLTDMILNSAENGKHTSMILINLNWPKFY